jgi:hypothetical protein
MLVRRCARFAGPLAGLVLLVGVVACGKDASSNTAPAGAVATIVATPVDVDFSVTGVDPSRLCFDASTLPANFVADGDGVVSSVTDAAAGSGDPAQRAKDLTAWGYVTGAYRQWSFSAPSAQTKQQQQTLPTGTVTALRTAEAGERQSTPYVGALCQLSLFQHVDGAHQAFASMRANLKSMQPAADPHAGLRDGDPTSVGNESASFFADASGHGSDIVVFRTGNVVGEAWVDYVCDQQACSSTGKRLEPEAVRLATLMSETLVRSLSHG